jgi:hypothetical protein
MDDIIAGADQITGGGDASGGAGGGWLDSLGLGDWFSTAAPIAGALGTAYLQTEAAKATAQAKANAAALQYGIAQEGHRSAIADAVTLKAAGVTGGGAIDSRMVLVIMVGAAIFFVINQANK